MVVFVRKDIVLRFFGSDVPKYKSYSVASVSGTILAVCSCTILPLFAGIYRRGSGIGPATAFLYSGPAINILAIVYTARVLGMDLGIARAVAAILLSIMVGMFMAFLFRGREAQNPGSSDSRSRPNVDTNGRGPSPVVLLVLLVGLLLVGTWKLQAVAKLVGIASVSMLIMVYISRSYSIHMIREWLLEAWGLARKILPALMLGTFVVGFMSYYLPPEKLSNYLVDTTISSCFLGSVIGGILYMPTLLEVPIIGTTFGYTSGYMGAGPALSLLLAGPAVSLPSLIVLYRILGVRRTAGYISLVVVFSTMAGFLFGMYV